MAPSKVSSSTSSAGSPAPPPVAAPFRGLYRQHLARTLEWSRRLGVPERDVPDVAQNAWVRAHGALPGYDPARPLLPWLRALVHAAAREHLGRPYVRREIPSDHADLIDEAALAAVETAMDARTLLPLVMRRLSPEHQAVFLMIEVEQFTHAEVAQALSIPMGTPARGWPALRASSFLGHPCARVQVRHARRLPRSPARLRAARRLLSLHLPRRRSRLSRSSLRQAPVLRERR